MKIDAEHAPKLRLSLEARRAIVQDLVSKGRTQAEVAEMLGVSKQTISDDVQKLDKAEQKRRANAELATRAVELPTRTYGVILPPFIWR